MSDERPIPLRFTSALVLSIVFLAAPARAGFKAGLDADNRAASFTGPVVRVLEGDTFEVLHNDHPEHIRLIFFIPWESSHYSGHFSRCLISNTSHDRGNSTCNATCLFTVIRNTTYH